MNEEKELLPIKVDEKFDEILFSSKIELTKAQSHAIAFSENMNKVHELSKALTVLNKENPQLNDVKIARVNRLSLVKNRTDAEKIKTSRKENLLVESKLIDSLYGVIRNASELTESEYMAIEKHAENLEIQRKEALSIERWGELQEYCDPAIYPLGEMTEAQYNELFTGLKLAKEKREEDIIKAENERLEAIRKDNEERERIKVENEKLKAEAEEKDRLAEIERKKQAEAMAKVEAEKKAIEEKAKAERLESEKKAKAEAEEKAKIQKELQDKKDLEKLAIKKESERIESERLAKLKAEKEAQKAPDKDKLKLFVESFIAPVCTELSTNEAISKRDDIVEKFNSFKSWALKQSELI